MKAIEKEFLQICMLQNYKQQKGRILYWLMYEFSLQHQRIAGWTSCDVHTSFVLDDTPAGHAVLLWSIKMDHKPCKYKLEPAVGMDHKPMQFKLESEWENVKTISQCWACLCERGTSRRRDNNAVITAASQHGDAQPWPTCVHYGRITPSFITFPMNLVVLSQYA